MLLRTLDRHKTDCLKWDSTEDENMLCMWVADMEYETAPEIVRDMVQRASHGIYGYNIPQTDYYKVVCDWMKRRFDWDTCEIDIVCSPGNVTAIKLLLQCLSKEGDNILVQEPCYYMFQKSIEMNNRRLVTSPLVLGENGYEIDFPSFEQAIAENDVKIFLLCNPHNPVGRVFTLEELRRMGEICRKHHVLVISDEVHSDFVYTGKHIPFTKAMPEMVDKAIVLTGPSKTFNLAGLKCGNTFIHNPDLRQKYFDHLNACGVHQPNIFALVACRSAYLYGDRYVDELRAALKENIDFFDAYTQKVFPQLKLIPPEGSYLIWVDVRELGMTDEEIAVFLTQKAHVWVDEGTLFGKGGHGYIRFNIACSKAEVKEAVDRIKTAFASLK